jgi:16S rRNA C967 or C1407 C5-methylase (RsmB/RsmF family)
MSAHPFDRYAPYTDVAALKAISARPLRKSIRVNLLKTDVDTVKAWAQEKGWQLSPVPWRSSGGRVYFSVSWAMMNTGKHMNGICGRAASIRISTIMKASIPAMRSPS